MNPTFVTERVAAERRSEFECRAAQWRFVRALRAADRSERRTPKLPTFVWRRHPRRQHDAAATPAIGPCCCAA